MKVKDKTILVTGGGSGLGRELVLHLLTRGAHVIAVDIRESALAETKRNAGEYSGRLHIRTLDITDRIRVEEFASRELTELGTVDGLINNAGIIQPFKRVNDLDYPTIEKVMNVDFYGTLFMIKAFLPHFLTRPEAHIVNVSSMGGLFPVPGQSIYGAAKAAVKLLTEGLQAELADTPVHVTLVCPGAIETDIKFNSGAEKNRKNAEEAKRAGIQPVKPAKAAQLILEAMEGNKPEILIGKDIKSMRFLSKLSHTFTRNLINKQMSRHLNSDN